MQKYDLFIRLKDKTELKMDTTTTKMSISELELLSKIYKNKVESMGFIGLKTPVEILVKNGEKIVSSTMLNLDNKLYSTKNLKFGICYSDNIINVYNSLEEAVNCFDEYINKIKEKLIEDEYPLEFINSKYLKIVRLSYNGNALIDNFDLKNIVKEVEIKYGLIMSNKINYTVNYNYPYYMLEI